LVGGAQPYAAHAGSRRRLDAQAIEQPAFSQVRIANELRERGLARSDILLRQFATTPSNTRRKALLSALMPARQKYRVIRNAVLNFELAKPPARLTSHLRTQPSL
jgi:hypothetical protein